MSARDGYIGRAPGDSQVVIAKQKFEPTGVQTNFTFTSGYTVGYIDVYVNGLRKVNASDYTASDGSTVNLTSSVGVGTVVELVAYKAFNVANPISNTTSGSLEVGVNLTVTGTSNVGVVTGGTYYGDGSNLTGLPGQVDLWNKTAAGINTAVSVGIGTTRPDSIARVNNTSILNVGILTAYQLHGDGSNLTGLPGQVDLWSKTAAGINTLSNVGIGTTNPEDLLHLRSGSSGASSVAAAQLVLESSGSTNWIHFKNPSTQNAGLLWSDADATEKAVVMYNHNTDNMEIKGDDDIIFKTDSATRLTIDASGNSGFTGIVTASKFNGPGNIPQNIQAGSYTLLASDAGRHIFASGNINTGADDVFSAGDAVTIVNNTAGNLTITRAITTMYNAATADNNATYTLAGRGMVTILFVAGDEAFISGAGLS